MRRIEHLWTTRGATAVGLNQVPWGGGPLGCRVAPLDPQGDEEKRGAGRALSLCTRTGSATAEWPVRARG
jgi:hypothetical protein